MSDATMDPPGDPRVRRAAPRRRLRLSWSDPRMRAIVWQAVLVALVAFVVWYLASNTARNLADRHIATGFGFVDAPASMPIGEHLVPFESSVNTYGRALLVGLLNTLKVALLGIVLTTVLGTLIGIGRLSSNVLVARLTAIYVETLRDVPVLLQLLFWYVLLTGLPAPKRALHLGQSVFLDNRGLQFPLLDWAPGHTAAVVAFVAGVVLFAARARRMAARQAATGARPPSWPAALGLLAGLPLLAWLALGAPASVERPALHGFNFAGGGLITPEYATMLIGLTLYTAAYVAEIVRSGIEAVPHGQWEAAGALGLSRGHVLRLIVLPQAVRVVIPPMTSQYLNLTKNTSLAIAVGYQDTFSIANTVNNQTGQAIEITAIVMLIYLSFSLTTSALLNWYSARIARSGR